MCGIFGYSGQQQNAGQIVMTGLKRLDYRGYDSWGVAVAAKKGISVVKSVGKIGEVSHQDVSLPGQQAIAHTRWATTGSVTNINAHPHLSSDGSFALAQNGIVENFRELKTALLQMEYSFISETDTEVIVRLIEQASKEEPRFIAALRTAFLQLQGRNTVVVLRKDGEILAARNGSPLVVGCNSQTKEVFLSSDTLSFAPYVDKIIVLENNQLVTVSRGDQTVRLFSVETGEELPYTWEEMNLVTDTIDMEGYDHFMVKEIHESPQVIRQILQQDQHAYTRLATAITTAHQVYVIGSGTAGFAASQIAFYLRIYGQIPAVSLVGADARSYYDLFQPGDVIIAPSQSGETADVIEVLEYAKQQGLAVASLVNMPGSAMTRMSDFPFMSQAGPEICVMSTKVFCSQIAWGYLVAKTVQGKFDEGRKNLLTLVEKIEAYLRNPENTKLLQNLAKRLASKTDIFLLGKYQNLAIIHEGMVKLIEGTYRHAHAIPAGDLKHYAITLMEKGVPVIAVVSNDLVKNDLDMAINEVRLRGAEVIAIAHDQQDNYDFLVPIPDTGETDAIGNVIPLQLLAYYLAVKLGNNVDKPRNIAKSVTVK